MKQLINLYPPELRNEGIWPSATFLLFAALLGFLVMILVIGASAGQLYMAKMQLEAKDEKKAEIQAEIDVLAGRALPEREQEDGQHDVEQVEQRIARQQRLRNLLRSNVFTGVEGYSGFFVGLAQQAVPGVWLTQLSIRGAGADMHLAGRTTDAKLVPKYIERISTEAAFSNTRFEIYRLEKSNAAKGETGADEGAGTDAVASIVPCCEFSVSTRVQ